MKDDGYHMMPAAWRELVRQTESLLEASTDPVANAANLSSIVYHSLADVSWVGFYFFKDDALLVGPFQGPPACVRIGMGKGVCGMAAMTGKTQHVRDVEAFEGHIACDPAARSEVAVPLFKNQQLVGVLDIDSHRLDRFSEADVAGCVALAGAYLASID